MSIRNLLISLIILCSVSVLPTPSVSEPKSEDNLAPELPNFIEPIDIQSDYRLARPEIDTTYGDDKCFCAKIILTPKWRWLRRIDGYVQVANIESRRSDLATIMATGTVLDH